MPATKKNTAATAAENTSATKRTAAQLTAWLNGRKAEGKRLVTEFLRGGLNVGVFALAERTAHEETYGEKAGRKKFYVRFTNVYGISENQTRWLIQAAESFNRLPAKSVARAWATDQLAELKPVRDNAAQLKAAVKAAGPKPNRKAVRTAVAAQLPPAEKRRRAAASKKAEKAATEKANDSLARKIRSALHVALNRPDADPESIRLGIILGAGMAGADTRTAKNFGKVAGSVIDSWIADQAESK